MKHFDRSFYDSVLGDMLGNQNAAECLTILTEIAHTLDDLVDGDKEVTTDRLVDVFLAALVELPANPFFMANHQMLSGVLLAAMCNWLAANEMERGGNVDELQVSFVTRSSYADLVPVCAAVVGGIAHASSVAKKYRLRCASEGFSSYTAALGAEKRRG